MTTIVYIRPQPAPGQSADHITKQQHAAANAAGIQAGLPSQRDGDGLTLLARTMTEPAGGEKTLQQILSALGPDDAFVTATLGSLGTTPTSLIVNASKLVASGAKFVIADLPSGLDLNLLRVIAAAFRPLEERASRLSAEVDAMYASRIMERQEHEQEVRKALVNSMMANGIDVASLLTGGHKPAAKGDPILGKQLKTIREELALSPEEAGKLVVKFDHAALSKSDVTGIESGRIADVALVDSYTVALRAAKAKARVAQKIDAKIFEAKAIEQHGQPLTAGETATIAANVKSKSKSTAKRGDPIAAATTPIQE
ncbi:hypothetical protein [Ensifer sp. MJa1]|uniref:hypothetical protein n=1 Tax=Ensifer sp. MJa1 TaxID=2919888 RepID=UPI003008AACB